MAEQQIARQNAAHDQRRCGFCQSRVAAVDLRFALSGRSFACLPVAGGTGQSTSLVAADDFTERSNFLRVGDQLAAVFIEKFG